MYDPYIKCWDSERYSVTVLATANDGEGAPNPH